MGIWILLHWNAESLLLDMRLMPAIICLLVILQWAVLLPFQFTMRSYLCTRLCKMCIMWLCILWLFQFINHCLLYLWVFQSIFIYMEQVDYILRLEIWTRRLIICLTWCDDYDGTDDGIIIYLQSEWTVTMNITCDGHHLISQTFHWAVRMNGNERW